MLDENKTYAAICAEMAKRGIKLNIVNVHKYYTQQYQDSVAAAERVATLSNLHQDIRSLSPDDHANFHAAALEVGLVQTFKELRTQRTPADPQDSIRLYNAVARLSREAFLLRKHRDSLRSMNAIRPTSPQSMNPSSPAIENGSAAPPRRNQD
jgi:hypothetical protein